MATPLRLVVLLAVLLATTLAATRAAAAGIYCSSYSFPTCYGRLCCRVICVYCEDQDTGEIIHETCYEQYCGSF